MLVWDEEVKPATRSQPRQPRTARAVGSRMRSPRIRKSPLPSRTRDALAAVRRGAARSRRREPRAA